VNLDLLARIAAVIHGGTLASGAILLFMRQALPPLREEDVVRAFRALGMILGLSLGAFILGEAVAWPGRVNPGATGLGQYAVPASAEGLRLALFGLYWVSYVALEIWTLEPCRLGDRDGQIEDRPRYTSAARAVSRHALFNALVFLAVLALGIR
jgi:hypothetical protein